MYEKTNRTGSVHQWYSSIDSTGYSGRTVDSGLELCAGSLLATRPDYAGDQHDEQKAKTAKKIEEYLSFNSGLCYTCCVKINKED